MNRSTDALNELIKVARDGERFYLDASQKADSEALREIFRDMAEVRRQLMADLGKHVLERGETPSGSGTLTGTSHKLYAELLARLSRDADARYIAELEETEDRLLEQYRRALEKATSDEVGRILERHLLTVRATHHRMRALRQQIEASG